MINFKKLEKIARALKPIAQTGRNFHVTFVFNKKKMICIGNNDYSKQHPYHKFGKYRCKYEEAETTYTAGIHSETSALIKMGLEDCSHLTFVNVRIDNHGNAAISKPCINCENLLMQVSFKKLWYYDGEQYVCVKGN